MHRVYVHGYEGSESGRLHDQARTLEDLVHAGTVYPAGSRVLEAGCGVGAQTLPLARNSPGAHFTSVDVAERSLTEAKARCEAAGLGNVRFERADLRLLPFADAQFDHVFVCFVLEHLAQPEAALAKMRRVLRPGGTLTAIEGDHGSAIFHPWTEAAQAAITCQVQIQRGAGGDPMIGRRLFPLLSRARFERVHVTPRTLYVDGSSPALADSFVRQTFTTMVAGVREAALASGLSDASSFDRGIRALSRSAEPEGAFCYTFFKAVAHAP